MDDAHCCPSLERIQLRVQLRVTSPSSCSSPTQRHRLMILRMPESTLIVSMNYKWIKVKRALISRLFDAPICSPPQLLLLILLSSC